MIDLNFAESTRQKINDNKTYNNASYYGGFFAEDSGSTTHASILAPNGDAVAITSTINLYFGSKFRSRVTGIIMNNQMDDFSTPGEKNFFGVPPSPANYIKPKKRPFSSSSPIVILNKNGAVRMATGASGGTTITTSTALAVDDPRVHHQLIPMYVLRDAMFQFDPEIVDGLKRLGHTFSDKNFTAVVQAVAKGDDGLLYGKSDPRKGGHSAGF
ncbi:Gamma-glutamyltransferase light chain 1 [Exaiptasia diaphana]|nr:Gamma-glutamyltransferase light chain 1 [Exaiptasia diaphana]